MAQHEEIVLWLDRRWKNAIEKHLKGETLQEHLETVLDALCNQLPQREYERISREIYAEDAANREAEEAARTYAAYHVVENGQHRGKLELPSQRRRAGSPAAKDGGVLPAAKKHEPARVRPAASGGTGAGFPNTDIASVCPRGPLCGLVGAREGKDSALAG